MADLADVLGHWRADAKVLRRAGHTREAEQIETFAAEVERAAEEYLRWLSEADAVMRSGRRVAWLRAHFAEWQRAGNARQIGRRREYRAVVVPQGADTISAREAGRRAGQEGRAA